MGCVRMFRFRVWGTALETALVGGGDRLSCHVGRRRGAAWCRGMLALRTWTAAPPAAAQTLTTTAPCRCLFPLPFPSRPPPAFDLSAVHALVNNDFEDPLELFTRLPALPHPLLDLCECAPACLAFGLLHELVGDCHTMAVSKRTCYFINLR